MKQRIYVSPSANRKSGYPNRYFVKLKENLADYFDVLDSENKPCLMQGLALLRHSFRADIFLLSFVETVAFHKLAFIQYLMVRLSFIVMRLRGKRTAFIFHNPRPHKGKNWMSESLTKVQLKQACLVVSHSRATAAFARELLSEYGRSPDNVRYLCHPVLPLSDGFSAAVPQSRQVADYGLSGGSQERDDVLIWGNILPYKGVLEFASSPAVRSAGLKVRIVGRCNDPSLTAAIERAVTQCNSDAPSGFAGDGVSVCGGVSDAGAGLARIGSVAGASFPGCAAFDGPLSPDASPLCRTNIVFENRAAGFEELARLVRSSRHVLFPYLPGSVSGSGVLMDTLSMGGNPVGPDIGAFADLAGEDVCQVYGSEAEMIEILKSDRAVSPETLRSFISRNSWRAYAKFFADFFAGC